MEVHPDVWYDDPEEDPEENLWVLPRLPPPASVPDNTSCFWIFYVWRGVPQPGHWPLSMALTREITPPWRRGLGIMLRRSGIAVAFGLWFRGKAPRILTDAPAEKDYRKVVKRAKHLEGKREHR